MAFITLVTLLSAALALAGPSGMKVTLSAPKSVESIDDVRIEATVTNVGSSTLKLLRRGTVFDSSPTKSFTITKDGAEVQFQGIQPYYVAPSESSPTSFVTLGSGKSISVVHNVSALYNFEPLGPGEYTFVGNSHFFDFSGKTPEEVVVSAEPLSISVASDVTKRHLLPKRAISVCTNKTRAEQLSSTYMEARTLAQTAIYGIGRQGAGGSYKPYFGESYISDVAPVFDSVSRENDTKIELRCDETGQPLVVQFCLYDTDLLAYIYAPGIIYFCPRFYALRPIETICKEDTLSVRGMTAFHLLSQVVPSPATSDIDDLKGQLPATDCQRAQNLASRDYKLAARNTLNYDCYARDAYRTFMCS